MGDGAVRPVVKARKPKPGQSRIARLVSLTVLLHESRRGLRTVELAEKLDVARATVDRDLAYLHEAGVCFDKEPINGEVRHKLLSKPLPPLQPTPLQLKSLHLARAALAHLSGSRVLAEIDALLAPYPTPAQLDLPINLSHKSGNAAVLRALDSAITHRRQVALRYCAASRGGKERNYTVDPVFLREAGHDVYLGAHDHASNAPRRFKLSRIKAATFLDTPAAAHPEITEASLFSGAVKAWGGDPLFDVVVRLRPAVAWKAGEHALIASQIVEPQSDGSALIKARVAGLTETQQWVLAWGAAAEALEPDELRNAVHAELLKAGAAYQRPGIASAKLRKRPLKRALPKQNTTPALKSAHTR